MVEPSPPHIGEQQTVGSSSLPTSVSEVVGPSTSTVQDCTDDNMEGFVKVSRKKGQKRSCPVVNETEKTQSKILIVSDVPSLQDASLIENLSSGLGIEPELNRTLTNSFAPLAELPELYECDVDIENTRASQEDTSGVFENFGVCSDKK